MRLAVPVFAALMLVALAVAACAGPRPPTTWPSGSPAHPDAAPAPVPAAATSLASDPLAFDGGSATTSDHAHHHHAPAQPAGATDGGVSDGR